MMNFKDSICNVITFQFQSSWSMWLPNVTHRDFELFIVDCWHANEHALYRTKTLDVSYFRRYNEE